MNSDLPIVKSEILLFLKKLRRPSLNQYFFSNQNSILASKKSKLVNIFRNLQVFKEKSSFEIWWKHDRAGVTNASFRVVSCSCGGFQARMNSVVHWTPWSVVSSWLHTEGISVGEFFVPCINFEPPRHSGTILCTPEWNLAPHNTHTAHIDVRIHQNPWCKRLSGSKSHILGVGMSEFIKTHCETGHSAQNPAI